jgi:hypothetical protein
VNIGVANATELNLDCNIIVTGGAAIERKGRKRNFRSRRSKGFGVGHVPVMRQ